MKPALWAKIGLAMSESNQTNSEISFVSPRLRLLLRPEPEWST
jgi:hypothetical protein